MCAWEGALIFYRNMARHGGIFCRGFVQDWSEAQVYTLQNGRGSRGKLSRMTGSWVSGPETLTGRGTRSKDIIFTKNVWQTIRHR